MGHIVDLLVFLEGADIPFKAPLTLAEDLVSEIDNPKLSPHLLESLNLLHIVDEIPLTDRTKSFIDAAKKLRALPLADAPRQPTPAFKQFCGSEYLNAAGKISRASALDYVNLYVKNHRLREGEVVYLDATLQDVLQTQSNYISIYRLIELVDAVLAV
jgi:hypothetical protein